MEKRIQALNYSAIAAIWKYEHIQALLMAVHRSNLTNLVHSTSQKNPRGFYVQPILIATILTLFLKNSNAKFFTPAIKNFQTARNREYSFSTTSKGDGECASNEMEGERWAMVERTGTQFMAKGQPFFVNGFNTYWLMVFAADRSTREKVGEVFKQAAAVGLNVCRTWAFNDAGWRALQISPSVYDEEVFEGLDFVVSEARSHSIRLILSFCNNWEDYGGKAQYVKWGKEAGLNLTSDDEFFMDPTIKAYYKAHVEKIVNRINTFSNVKYKDDPTIFAWELMNEPRCPMDPSGDTLQTWIEEMAHFVKSIDPAHLLEIGLEGFYGPSTPDKLQLNPNPHMAQLGTDFIRNHQIPAIDFASVHIYSDSWLPDSFSGKHFDFVEKWMRVHMDDAENLLNMPAVFGEFGVSVRDERFDSEFREAFISTVHEMLLVSRRRGGSGGGSLLWQLFPEGTEHMDDGYAVVLAKSPATSNAIALHAAMLQEAGGEDDGASRDEL